MKDIIVGIGEILWDILPTGKVLGGAPANFAYHISQLGFDGFVVSAIGDDELGEEIIENLRSKNMNFIIERVPFPTGTVQVALNEVGVPCYEICENVKRFSIQDVAFYDDALLCNFETGLEKILSRVRKNTCSINYHTPNGIHPRFISKYIAEFLKYSGFKTIRLSVESFDKKIQKQSSFKLFFSEFENAMKNLIDAGFSKQEIGAYILAGLPEQTIDDIIDTIRVLKEFPCKIKIAEYSPIPGTQDYEITRKIYPSLPLEEPLFQNNSIFPLWNFKNKWETIEKIKHIAKDI